MSTRHHSAKFDILEVTWEDSMCSHGWQDEEKLAAITPIRTVGYAYKDNKEGITLVESLNDAVPNTLGIGCAVAIPRSQIRAIKVLRKKQL